MDTPADMVGVDGLGQIGKEAIGAIGVTGKIGAEVVAEVVTT